MRKIWLMARSTYRRQIRSGAFLLLTIGMPLIMIIAGAMLIRMTSTALPVWQVAVSLVLLVLTGLGLVVLMARLFRAQTLLSGESFSLERFWAAVRSGG